MTGSNNYLVRKGFTQDDQFREVLGNSEWLLCFADTGYCIDAPERIPAGATQACKYVGARGMSCSR